MNELERWRNHLLKTNDHVFLNLVRNYLGPVKTPYHKQELLQRLENYLVKPETLQRMLLLFTLEDRRLLGMIHHSPGICENDLIRELAKDRSALQVHLHLLQLEDRLLIWRDSQAARIPRVGTEVRDSFDTPLGSTPIFLNPLLKKQLEPGLSLDSVLVSYDSTPPDPAQAYDQFWLDDASLCAFAAWLIEEPGLILKNGDLKRHVFSNLGERSSWPEPLLEQRCGIALDALLRLGILSLNDRKIVFWAARWIDLSRLELLQRRFLMLAAASLSQSPRKDPDFDYFHASILSQGELVRRAHRLLALWQRMEDAKLYPRESLSTLWRLDRGKESPDTSPDRGLDFDALHACGMLLQEGELYRRNPLLGRTHEPQPRWLAASPDGLISILAPGRAEELYTLALACRLHRLERQPVFSLERDAFMQACRLGYDKLKLQNLLERSQGQDMAKNLVFKLSDWQNHYESVKVWDGITLAFDRRFLPRLEALEALQAHLIAKPAENVWVFERETSEQWAPLLIEAGLPDHILPGKSNIHKHELLPPLSSLPLGLLHIPNTDQGYRPQTQVYQGDLTMVGSDTTNPSQNLGQEVSPEAQASKTAGAGEDQTLEQPVPHYLNRQELVEDLIAELKKLKLDDDEYQRTLQRIQSGLILDIQQLHYRLQQGEVLSAGGFDFQAKLRMIDSAIKAGNEFLEIQQVIDGSVSSFLFWPTALRGSGREANLAARTFPDNQELFVPLSKILAVKRVKASIFGPQR